MANLATTDPDFFQFLQENDQDLLAFGEAPEAEDMEGEGVDSEGVDSDDMGLPEQRPQHVTSRKEVCVCCSILSWV